MSASMSGNPRTQVSLLGHRRMADMKNTPSPATLMTLAEVTQITRLAKSRIYELVAARRFPEPRKIGRSSRWLASEIHAWMLNLPTASLAKADAQ